MCKEKEGHQKGRMEHLGSQDKIRMSDCMRRYPL
jgi:hypothetical protein